MIDKNSRILMIGASGTGKSNALMNYIEKSSFVLYNFGFLI
jgi:ABC-type lipoprotein export system ATPase subunit